MTYDFDAARPEIAGHEQFIADTMAELRKVTAQRDAMADLLIECAPLIDANDPCYDKSGRAAMRSLERRVRAAIRAVDPESGE